MSAHIALRNEDDLTYCTKVKFKRAVEGDNPTVLTSIFDEETNIVIWHRQLDALVFNSVEALLDLNPNFELHRLINPQRVYSIVKSALSNGYHTALAADVADLIDMFCCLFDLNRVGLRMTSLNEAMCPRFHVDMVPCRLVTTYQGPATEWLHDKIVDRSKLGGGSLGMTDRESGLYKSESDLQRLNAGDVALLKGGAWIGNEGSELVHRSPSLSFGEKRLLLTVDFG